MRVRIEHKFSHRYTELYVNGVRENVAEINPDVPIESLGYLCHRDDEKVWAEFEADVEIIERETDYGAVYRAAEVKDIRDCV